MNLASEVESPITEPVRAGELYPLGELGRRLHLTTANMKTLLEQGLPTCKVAGRKYVIGSQVIDWLESRANK